MAGAIAEGLDTRAAKPYQPGMPDPREWFSLAGRRHRLSQDENQIFQDAVAAAERERTAWYFALDSLSSITPAIWHAITPSDQLSFLARYRSVWNEYRHSMPLVNARLLLPAVRTGQLTVHRGLRAISPEASGTGRRWRCTVGSGAADPPYDVLVDATGGQLDVACRKDTLLWSALRRGILRGDPRGGVRVTFATCQVISANGVAYPNLYLVGPMTFGTHFYTNSFEINRDNAFRVARDIRASLADEQAIPVLGGR